MVLESKPSISPVQSLHLQLQGERNAISAFPTESPSVVLSAVPSEAPSTITELRVNQHQHRVPNRVMSPLMTPSLASNGMPRSKSSDSPSAVPPVPASTTPSIDAMRYDNTQCIECKLVLWQALDPVPGSTTTRSHTKRLTARNAMNCTVSTS